MVVARVSTGLDCAKHKIHSCGTQKTFTSTLQIPGETGYTQCLAYIKYITGCFNRHLNISNVTSNRTLQISNIPNTHAHPRTTKVGVSN